MLEHQVLPSHIVDVNRSGESMHDSIGKSGGRKVYSCDRRER